MLAFHFGNPAAALVLAAAATLAGAPAHAAQFEIIYKSCPDDDGEKLAKVRELPANCMTSTEKLSRGRIALRLTGDIAVGDAERLEKLLGDHIDDVATFGYAKGGGSYVSVYLSGEAGTLDGAIALGRFFKANAVQTRIARDARCSGPCAIAFMGGRAQWGRLTRRAIDRRLEAGGELAFRSPLFPDGEAVLDADQLRDRIRGVQDYAAYVRIPPLVLAKILALKQAESFAVDNVFWAKVANITVDGVLPAGKVADEDYVSACLSQINWGYGLRGEYGEPPKDEDTEWDSKILYRDKRYLIVAAVWSFARYNYWCALNASRTQEVKIPPRQLRAALGKWGGRNSLAFRILDQDVDLKGNGIYYSKAPNDLSDTRAMNSLDLLLRKPDTKLKAIADPQFRRNAWADWDPWFEHEAP
jgi:hypothetical protein